MATTSPAESELSSITHGVLTQSFAMIIASEIGDKTFLIAAILAMRHSRAVVFAGAFGSLVVMSCLSAAMGHILPTLVPRRWTQVAAATLFLVFGCKMLQEGRAMASGNDKIREELREVEEEINEEEALHDGTGATGAGGEVIPLEAIEEGGHTNGHGSPLKKRRVSRSSVADGTRNFCALLFGPVFVQTFVLTFLGEWGDRSQIATMALAAAHNLYVVAFGTVVGHGCCTALAVLGGRWISTKISVKHVTLGGACLFLLFSIIYYYEAWTSNDTGRSIDISSNIMKDAS